VPRNPGLVDGTPLAFSGIAPHFPFCLNSESFYLVPKLRVSHALALATPVAWCAVRFITQCDRVAQTNCVTRRITSAEKRQPWFCHHCHGDWSGPLCICQKGTRQMGWREQVGANPGDFAVSCPWWWKTNQPRSM